MKKYKILAATRDKQYVGFCEAESPEQAKEIGYKTFCKEYPIYSAQCRIYVSRVVDTV